jgi:hypothetical protein
VVGLGAGYMWFVTDLGLALCDSGDCRPDDARDEIYQAVTMICLVAVVGIGVVSWRERRGQKHVN